jgi:outer membrane protein assembly factor BamD (BamD/ComL family)
MILSMVGSCAYMKGTYAGKQELDRANQLMAGGDQEAALSKYGQLLERFPELGDQALFRMGLIYAKPKDAPAEYQKASGSLQKLLKNYPDSQFRQDSEILIMLIQDISSKEQKIKGLQHGSERIIEDITSKEQKIKGLQSRIVTLEKKVDALEMQIEKMKEIDLNAEAKKRKRAL